MTAPGSPNLPTQEGGAPPTLEAKLDAVLSGIQSINSRITSLEFESASQKVQLDALTKGHGKTSYTDDGKTFQTPAGPQGSSPSRAPAAPGPNPTTRPIDFLTTSTPSQSADTTQLGPQGGPYGLTPAPVLQQTQPIIPPAKFKQRPRQSMGVSGILLPPQASPVTQRPFIAPKGTAASMGATHSAPVPKDSDPAMLEMKTSLLETHIYHQGQLHPDWPQVDIEEAARKSTANDYLEIRRTLIADSLRAKTLGETKMPSSYEANYRSPVKRANWDMLKFIDKLNWNNWAYWQGSIYSMLSNVPGAIGILEGVIHGPWYLGPDDDSHHEAYDESLDLELGQIINSSIEPEIKALLLRPTTSEQELRGSFYYRELRSWLLPSAGYAALRLSKKIAETKQDENEPVRKYGERLRKLFVESQCAGDPLDQKRQVSYLLLGVNYRFRNARENMMTRQRTEKLTFDTVLHELYEVEEAQQAFADTRRTQSKLPPLSRPSAHMADLDSIGDDEIPEEDDDIIALSAQVARHFIQRRDARRNMGGSQTQPPRPFNKPCFCCKKVGHMAVNCPDVAQAAPNTTNGAKALVSTEQTSSSNPQQGEGCTCNHSNEQYGATLAETVPSLGAFEAQVWEDEIGAVPTALNVINAC